MGNLRISAADLESGNVGDLWTNVCFDVISTLLGVVAILRFSHFKQQLIKCGAGRDPSRICTLRSH